MKKFLEKLFFFLPSKETIKHNRSYILLGLCVFCLGFVWNFPAQGIINTMIKRVESQTGVSIEADKLSYAFPAGLKGENLKITNIPMAALSQTGIELEKVNIKLSPLSLITYPLKESGSFTIKGQQKKMSFNTTVKLNKDVIRVNGSAKSLKMDHDLFIPSASANMAIQGLLNVQFNFLSNMQALQKNDFSSLQGTLKGALKQATMTPPLMSAVKFDQLSLDSKIEKSKAVIKFLKMDGPMLSGSINGFVDLRPVIDRSIANLDGKLQTGKEGQSLKSMLEIAGIRFDASGKGAFKITGPLNAINLKSY